MNWTALAMNWKVYAGAALAAFVVLNQIFGWVLPCVEHSIVGAAAALGIVLHAANEPVKPPVPPADTVQ